jgi:hypothetical protein
MDKIKLYFIIMSLIIAIGLYFLWGYHVAFMDMIDSMKQIMINKSV